MNRAPRLIATLSRGSQGLRLCGAALAEADARLDRLEQTDSTGFEVPDGWAALLGAAQIDDERLRRDPATTRADEFSTPVIGEGGRAEPEAVLRRAAAAPPGAPLSTPAQIRPVSPPRHALGERPRPSREKDNRPSQTPIKAGLPQWLLPRRTPIAAIGADQRLVRRTEITELDSMAAINGPNPPQTPPSVPPDLPTAQEQRMTRVLDRIPSSGDRARPVPRAPCVNGQTAPSAAFASNDAPTTRTEQAVSGPATPDTAPLSRTALSTAIPPQEPEATHGLSRLLARGRALGVAPAPASSAPGHRAPAPMGTAPTWDWPVDTMHRPPSAPEVARPSRSSPASPAAIETPPTARPLARDRLARDLAELLRREARAAGIDLDGGAP